MQKSLFKNSIYNVLYRVLSILFPLITVSYVSNIIFADGVGRVGAVQNKVQYFVIIAALGIPNYGIREISKCKGNSREYSRVFSELFVINMISTILCTVVYYLAIIMMFSSLHDQSLFLLVGLSIVLNLFNVEWFFQGLEEFGFIAFRSFIVKVVSLVAVFIFIKNEDDYVCYAALSVIAMAGNYIWNIFALKKYSLSFKWSELNIKRHIRPVAILLCTTISIELYTLVDVTMIDAMCSKSNVGYYNNSMSIVRMIIVAIAAISGVLLPRLSYYYSKNMIKECENVVNKITQILMFLFIPCFMGLFIDADLLMPVLFGPTFIPAIVTMRIAAFLILTLGFSNLFGTQVLLTFNGEKRLLICTVVGALINISMNSVMIPRFEQNGAAFASVISELVVTVLTLYFARKHLHIVLLTKSTLLSAISGVVMVASIVVFRNCISLNDKFELAITVALGVIVYMLMALVFKHPVLFELINLLKNKKQQADIQSDN